MSQIEEINNFFKESTIKENEMPFNIIKDKKELYDSIAPKINDTLLTKDETNFLKYNNTISSNNNINSPDFKNSEYFDYKMKKIKLFNLYNSLLEFREKLIKKEKELAQREKNLLEFENILKTNETILKNNIEQFDSYIKNKINEIKNQFNQIEKLQFDKENYLKKREENIMNYEKQNTFKSIIHTNSNINNTNSTNCNCDICNEDEIIKPFIDNYLSEINLNKKNGKDSFYKKVNFKGRNNSRYTEFKNNSRNIHHQRNNTTNNASNFQNDSEYTNFQKKNLFESINFNKNRQYRGRNISNMFNSNEFNTINNCNNMPGNDFFSF